MTGLRFGLAATIGSTMVAAAIAHGEPPTPELACIEAAQESTLLDEPQGERLCLGASGTAPVACYETAMQGVAIDEFQAVDLCRCATSTEPAVCYEKALELRPSEPEQALRRCSPIQLERLTGDCRPIVPTDPTRTPS
jgi:hypothetical protein